MKCIKYIINRVLICAAIVIFLLPVAEAFSVSGRIQYITAPSSVLPNVLESDDYAFVFQEQQQVSLSNNLLVDRLTSTGFAGSILAGTVVNSTFLHFDPVGIGSHRPDQVTVMGSIVFDSPVLGLIWSGVACPEPCPVSPEYIDASDYLGAAGTQYPTGGLGRGLEADPYYGLNGSRDFVVNSGASSTSIDFTAFPNRSDQLRIITAALPEPGTFWLFILGVTGLFFIRSNIFANMPVVITVRSGRH